MSAPSPGARQSAAANWGSGQCRSFGGETPLIHGIGNVEKHYSKYLGYQEKFDQHLWGVSTGPDHNLDHIEMTVHFDPGEEFVLHRLEREKRHGTVELLDSQTCRFSADVYDASEILPWLRTFIGRIVDLKCSSQYVLDMFQEDLARMDALYGGGNDVIQ
jgi:hypothetical protein